MSVFFSDIERINISPILPFTNREKYRHLTQLFSKYDQMIRYSYDDLGILEQALDLSTKF